MCSGCKDTILIEWKLMYLFLYLLYIPKAIDIMKYDYRSRYTIKPVIQKVENIDVPPFCEWVSLLRLYLLFEPKTEKLKGFPFLPAPPLLFQLPRPVKLWPNCWKFIAHSCNKKVSHINKSWLTKSWDFDILEYRQT